MNFITNTPVELEIEKIIKVSLPPELSQFIREEKFNLFLNELSIESDRGAIILTVAVIDDMLKHWFHQLFKAKTKDDKTIKGRIEGPLISFSVRCDLLLALGIIKDHLHKSFVAIRLERNRFAHDLEIRRIDQRFDNELSQKIHLYKVFEFLNVKNEDLRLRFNIVAALLLTETAYALRNSSPYGS